MRVENIFKVFAASTVLSTTGSIFLFGNVHAEQMVNVMPLHQEDVCDVVPLSTQPKVAVIGAGIGGSSATHFLRKLLGPSAVIHVYEKSERIGGRLDVITVNDDIIEAGGSFIHSSNQYMGNFTKDMGLEKNEMKDGSGTLGIYDGNEFVFKESSNSLLTALQMVWRYGVMSLWNLNSSLKKMLTDFQTIYRLQDEGRVFQNVPDMLKAMGGEYFFDYTQQTIKEVLRENGAGERLIDEVVTAIDRSHYGQDSGVNAFTGHVSLAGFQGGSLWNVKGGNYLVCERLLQHSKATVYMNTKIDSIRKEVKDNKPVYFLDGQDKSRCNQPYDAVVVAVPLEVPACFMTCPECADWPEQDKQGRYQQTIASFVQAELNYKYFGYESAKEIPNNVLTTENESLPFSSIGAKSTTNGTPISPSLYKVFSRTPLTDETINKLFIFNKTTKDESTAKVQTITWLAHPYYTPPERFSSFLLDEGVFYVNAIERATSTMEMSAIGGRNAALLIKQYLKKIGKEN